MKNQSYSFSNEYRDMQKFIRELQESALEHSDELLSAKKELEYKKRQQEYVLEDRKKKQMPNISMFSPLNVGDSEDGSEHEEYQKLIEQLAVAEERCQKQKQICHSFERLKNFLASVEQKIETNPCSSGENFINYSTKLIETQEMDRNRISRELHDSTVQGLTSLVHKMEYCSRLVDIDPVRVKMELQSMIEFNKEIINDIRAIIYDLRPMSLNNIGLVSTIESFFLYFHDKRDLVSDCSGSM